MGRTIDYYNNNSDIFNADTADVCFDEVQTRFLSHLPQNALILDFGCGSGRDSKYFLEKGFRVEATDGSAEMCKIATRNTGLEVKLMLFAELSEAEKYDGIWACASILHLTEEELEDVWLKMIKATNKGGYIYTSFKYGDFRGYRGERYYTDYTEETFHKFIRKYSNLEIIDEWQSSDVRPGRGEERWLNLILRRTS